MVDNLSRPILAPVCILLCLFMILIYYTPLNVSCVCVCVCVCARAAFMAAAVVCTLSHAKRHHDRLQTNKPGPLRWARGGGGGFSQPARGRSYKTPANICHVVCSMTAPGVNLLSVLQHPSAVYRQQREDV